MQYALIFYDFQLILARMPAELPHYLRLAEKVGGRIIQHQGGTKIFFPPDSVLLQVKRKLNLSPERRAALAARMKDLQATVVE